MSLNLTYFFDLVKVFKLLVDLMLVVFSLVLFLIVIFLLVIFSVMLWIVVIILCPAALMILLVLFLISRAGNVGKKRTV